MTGQVFINTKDAFTTWKMVLQQGSFEELLKPAPQKALIENESRAIDGKQVVAYNPRMASRELTLKVSISGTSQANFLTNMKNFFEELKGISVWKVTALNMTFRLVYKDCQKMNYKGTDKFSSFMISFEEPYPTNRAN